MLRKSLKTMIVAATASALAMSVAAAEGIKVGLAFPLSGSNGDYFVRQMLNPTLLAIEKINEAGGLLGHPVEYVVEDHQASASIGASVGQKLVSIDNVDVILTTNSGSTLAMLPIAGAASTPVMATAYDGRIGEDPWGFNCVYANSALGQVMGEYVHKELGSKTMAFLAQNLDAIRGQINATQATFEGLGGSVVTAEYFAMTDTDYRGQLSKIIQADPDVIAIYAAGPSPYGIALKQMAELGFKPKAVVTLDTIVDAQVWKMAGDLATGIPYISSGMDQDWAQNEFIPRFDYEPLGLAAQSYDCAAIYFEAVKRAGTKDRDTVLKTLRNLSDFSGVAGEWGYEGTGHATLRPVIYLTKPQ